ncbi:Olfactory receptor 13A1 [Heterocephalus glaber]|uniref:Olfactory receptor 13A1 n=1 Tax=Heterocephalus glaber TaxID=10181 RepID=G5AYB0_HETGA|nr:Olfactory receptor 13A1 [Heterocephalus glaber]
MSVIITLLTHTFYGCLNFLLILLSYGYIISRILCMHSAEGLLYLLFSPPHGLCVLRICVLCLHATASSNRAERNEVSQVLYSTLSPDLNPLIYTLRNQEVRHALGGLLPFFRCQVWICRPLCYLASSHT